MNCGVGRRSGLLWLWLWCRLAAAAPIQPLAWELSYATGADIKKKEKDKTIDHLNFSIFRKIYMFLNMGCFKFYFSVILFLR